MEHNSLYMWGFIVGLAAALLVAVVIGLIARKFMGERKYDERQMLARLKAFRCAFWTLLTYLAVGGLLYGATGWLWMDLTAFCAVGICLGVTVDVVVCIHNDAYFALNDNPRFYSFLFGGIALMNLGITVLNIAHGTEFFTDGQLNFHAMNAVVVIMFTVLFIALIVRSLRRKAETAEGEGEA